MDAKLTNKFLRRFPHLYWEYYLPMDRTCMCWGFTCNNGWENILWQLSLAIEDELKFSTLEIFKFKIFTTYWKGLNYLKRFASGKPLLEKAVTFIPKFYNVSHRFSVGQVKEKFGCYDKKTEVLTEAGWKYFKDVTYADKIATLDNNKYLSYQLPSDIIAYKYSGKMYKIKTRAIDIKVTPNHNLYVAKGSYYNGRYVPPKKIDRPFELTTYLKYFGKNKAFKKDCVWIGEYKDFFILPEYHNEWKIDKRKTRKHYGALKLNMNYWLSFLGRYIAEGRVDIRYKGTVSMVANNADGGKELKTIKHIIRKLGYTYSVCQTNRSAAIIRIYNKQLALWLYDNCGHGVQNKNIPKFVGELVPNQIKIFLNSLFSGDGHQSKTAHILTTTSKKVADYVQELIFKAGNVATIYPARSRASHSNKWNIVSKYKCYEINWMTASSLHNTANKGMAKKSVEKLVQYNEMVYCVTVPNNIIYVRRNGKSYWCGNSLRYYWHGDFDNKKINQFVRYAEFLTQHTCERCGKPGTLNNSGYIRCLCKECENAENNKKQKNK